MKRSIYNLDADFSKTTHIIYNTITGAAILLENKYYQMYYENDFSDSKFVENMRRGGFYVDDEIDEIEYIKRESLAYRNSLNNLSLTIAPTLFCNFRCPYCYEEGHRYNTMSNEIVDGTINFISKEVDSLSTDNMEKGLFISWYGGEPLLEPNIIKTITDGITVSAQQSSGKLLYRITQSRRTHKDTPTLLESHIRH